MTDLEIVRLCAEAMGYEIDYSETNGGGRGNTGFDILGAAVLDWHNGVTFNPLRDDAQAMALVRRFKLRPAWNEMATEPRWEVFPSESSEMLLQRVAAILQGGSAGSFNENLNRAICECVAKMQAAK